MWRKTTVRGRPEMHTWMKGRMMNIDLALVQCGRPGRSSTSDSMGMQEESLQTVTSVKAMIGAAER